VREFLRRSLHSALSTGPGYEHQPPGAFVDTDRVRGYFIDFRAKTTAASAAHPSELVPAGLAQLALGWWERHLSGERDAHDSFLGACEALEARSVREGRELFWSYDVPVPKYHLVPPWCSALAQAQIASVFVRASLSTGEDRFAAVALGAIAPILPASSSGLLASTADGPAPEEAPTRPASLILNGWIYALWGLWDVAVGLGDDQARALFDESTACLLRTIGRYDTGWWSRYSLYPHRLTDLAKPFYHRLHVHQLEMLERLVGNGELGATARRWASYDTGPRRVGAIAQKAVFAAIG